MPEGLHYNRGGAESSMMVFKNRGLIFPILNGPREIHPIEAFDSTISQTEINGHISSYGPPDWVRAFSLQGLKGLHLGETVGCTACHNGVKRAKILPLVGLGMKIPLAVSDLVSEGRMPPSGHADDPELLDKIWDAYKTDFKKWLTEKSCQAEYNLRYCTRLSFMGERAFANASSETKKICGPKIQAINNKLRQSGGVEQKEPKSLEDFRPSHIPQISR